MSTALNNITSSVIGALGSEAQLSSNPEIVAALQQISTILQKVSVGISAGNLDGNMSPNVNTTSENTVTSTNIGQISGSVDSPGSNDVINNEKLTLNHCVFNTSAISNSPITVVVINNCTFNSNAVDTVLNRAKVNQQDFEAEVNVDNNISEANVSTWVPFIEQLKTVGFSPTTVISLLKQYKGDTTAVLHHIYQ